MPKTSWISFAPTKPDATYLALLSYLPLRHFRAIPKFFRYARKLNANSKPRVHHCYALQARPFSRQFWTLSVWEDQQSLNNFVRQIPHSQIMQALAAHMGETNFAQWTVTSA